MLPDRHKRPLAYTVIIFPLLLIFLILQASCADRETDRREALLRSLPPEAAAHLKADEDSAFARYGREAGIEVMMITHSRLGWALRDLTDGEYEDEAPYIFSLMNRTARVLSSEFYYGGLLADLEILESLSPAGLRECLELRARSKQIVDDPDLSIDGKIEMQAAYLDTLIARGDWIYVAFARMSMAEIFAVKGNDEKHMFYLRAALADFERYGIHRMTCQALGILGGHYRRGGDIDSMTICYEKARRLAERSRLPTQAGRISSFYGGYYRATGRLSLAHDMYRDAMDLCREYGGGHLEARFVVEAMGFYADLSCWDITERLIERSRILERLYAEGKVMDLFVLRTDQIEARLLLARGDVEGAEEIISRISKAVSRQFLRGDYAKLIYYQATGLLDNGLACRARPVAAEGITYCAEKRLPEWEARFTLLLARCEFECGNISAAAEALARFGEIAEDPAYRLNVEWIDHDVLSGKLSLTAGDREQAEYFVLQGVDRLGSYVSGRDASVHSYLWIDSCDDLRQLMHDVYSGDSSIGYGAELFWRRFFRHLGTGKDDLLMLAPGRHGGGELVGELRRLAGETQARITNKGAVHLLYLIKNGEVWRWTVSAEGIERDVLPVSTDELRKLAAEARRGMASDPGNINAAVPAGLTAVLAELAQALLPESVLAGTEDAPLLVTSNGFLGQIPFETFNLSSSGGYLPLLMKHDVAYLRFADPETGTDDEMPGVILASPEPPPPLRRRYPFQQRLGEVIVEGSIIAASDPEAIFLREDEATKKNLLSVWEKAPYIYIATHTLRDPEVPYVTLIPLASPGGQAGHEELFLDIADIRSADLGGCGLFVLSGCSTGSPYCEDITAGPSFGDACLDAGAHAVIQTFWDVRDDEARVLMSAFVDSWKRMETPPVRALCDCRRRAMKDEGTIRHPFNWAAYSIKLGRL